jgi:hypothetical protein
MASPWHWKQNFSKVAGADRRGDGGTPADRVAVP